MSNQAIILHDSDNVATAMADLARGTRVQISGRCVTMVEDIPFGHKYALTDLGGGEVILKYGESIGLAASAIAAGAHVHVHNVESQRGRGDKVQNEEGQKV